MTNVVTRVREVATERPDATALAVAGTETPYGRLWEMVREFAAGLRSEGVGPGDPVALYLPNLPQSVVAFHGTLAAGAVAVPIDPRREADELRRQLLDSSARGIVTLEEKLPAVEEAHRGTALQFIVTADGDTRFSDGFASFLAADPLDPVERDDDAVAALTYTDGTTGQPKGVRLTHRNLAASAEAVMAVPGGVDSDDDLLCALPPSHTTGATVGTNAGLFAGATLHLLREPDARRALSLVDREGVSLLYGRPGLYADAVELSDAASFDLSSLRLAGAVGASVSADVRRRFEERFGVAVHAVYGLTETGPTHFETPDRERRAGSVGTPLRGVVAAVVDADFVERPLVEPGAVDDPPRDAFGEIVIGGPGVAKGYHDLPATNDAAFVDGNGTRWLRTGDVGYRDEDGFLYVVDRNERVVADDRIVSPSVVESTLAEHEAVTDVAVVSVPRDGHGEAVTAFVVPATEAVVSETALTEHCATHLDDGQHPDDIELVAKLPRTADGVVRRSALRKRLGPAP